MVPAEFSASVMAIPFHTNPDQMLETLQNLRGEDWRGRIAPAGTATPSNSDTQQSFTKLGNWLAPLPKPGEIYDLSGNFTLTALPPSSAKLGLFLPGLGSKTSVWINGHPLARDLDTSAHGAALALETSQLTVGLNRVQMIVTPVIERRNHIPELTRLGSLQIRTPAPTWQRHVFNGYAQIIVQAGKTPGAINLTARSEKLQPATITITGDSAAPPASVP